MKIMNNLLVSCGLLALMWAGTGVAAPTDGIKVCPGMEPSVVGPLSMAGGCDVGDINRSIGKYGSSQDKAVIKAMADFLLSQPKPHMTLYRTVWTVTYRSSGKTETVPVTIAIHKRDNGGLPPHVWRIGLKPDANIERCEILQVGVAVDAQISLEEAVRATDTVTHEATPWLIPHIKAGKSRGWMPMPMCLRKKAHPADPDVWVLTRAGNAVGGPSWQYFVDYTPGGWLHQDSFRDAPLPNHRLDDKGRAELLSPDREGGPLTEYDALMQPTPGLTYPAAVTGNTAPMAPPATPAPALTPESVAQQIAGRQVKTETQMIRFGADRIYQTSRDGVLLETGTWSIDADLSIVFTGPTGPKRWPPSVTPEVMKGLLP